MMPNRSFAALSALSAKASLLALLCLAGSPAALAHVSLVPAQIAPGFLQAPDPSTQIRVTPLTEAGQLERQGRYHEALSKVDTVIAADPDQARPRFLKGVILMNMNRPADAIKVFEKLREDFPEVPEPYNNLAVLYMRQGLFEQARATLEIAVQANPGYAMAHENLGDIYSRMAANEYTLAGANAARKLQLSRDILTPPPVKR